MEPQFTAIGPHEPDHNAESGPQTLSSTTPNRYTSSINRKQKLHRKATLDDRPFLKRLSARLSKGAVKQFFGIGTYDVKTLDFKLLARKHSLHNGASSQSSQSYRKSLSKKLSQSLQVYQSPQSPPSVQWHQLSSKQQSASIREALRSHSIVLDPHCEYLKYWDVLTLAALCFTAVVTPYEVAFLHTSFNALFVLNRFIDLIFLKDLILQFFIAVPIKSGMVRDRKQIAKLYLSCWFWIDLLSILPFDTMGLLMASPAIQKLKVIRIIRLLRMLKLAKMLRASQIFKRWENATSLSYAKQGLIKFTILLVMIMHWMGCVWGLLGLFLGTDLKCQDDGSHLIEDTIDGGSWITSRGWGPNSPCHHFDAYLASAHFAVMTVTSIGYGDIVPTRSEELVLGILCQLMGGLTWAYAIGSICGIIASSNPVRIKFEQSMDALNSMLAEHDIDPHLRMELREYLRQQQYHNFLLRAREISNNFSPELQEAFIPETLIGKALRKVWYFHNAHPAFLVEMAHSLECMQHSPQEKIGGFQLLCIIQRGRAVRKSRICLPGDVFGEDMILTALWLADSTQGIALNYVEVLSLRKQALDALLFEYPAMKKSIRKAAVLIAFRKACQILAKERIKLIQTVGAESVTFGGTSRTTLIEMLEQSLSNMAVDQHGEVTQARPGMTKSQTKNLAQTIKNLAHPTQDGSSLVPDGPLRKSTTSVDEVVTGHSSHPPSPTGRMSARRPSSGFGPEGTIAPMTHALDRRLNHMENRLDHHIDSMDSRLISMDGQLRSRLDHIDVQQANMAKMLANLCVAMNVKEPTGAIKDGWDDEIEHVLPQTKPSCQGA